MTRWRADEEVAAQLADRFREWTDCNATHDTKKLATILHEDFEYFGAHGQRETKGSYLQNVPLLDRGGIWIIHSYRARVCGDLALVNGDYYAQVYLQGEDLSAHTVVTGVWVQEDGRWQCVAQHGSEYEPDEATRALVAAALAERGAVG